MTPSTNTSPSRLCQGSHLLEAVGFERRRGVERRRGGAVEQRAEAAARGGANHDGAAAGAQHAQQLAHRGHAILGAHRSQQSAGVVDDRQVERARVGGQRGRRRDLDLHQHAGVVDRLARARRRRVVGHERRRAPRDADLRGDGGEAAAVRAADLRDAIAQLHAGHADDEEMRFVALPPQGHHRSEMI